MRLTVLIRVLGGVILGACMAMSAAAQTPAPTVADQAAYEAAFQESLRKPSDPPTVLRYAELAIKVGNLEGAISALERLLLVDGDQPRIKLELGVLYFRLGSYQAARGLLESARASSRANAETKARAGQFIAEIEEKTGKSQLTGQTLGAIRYSTNANSGPSGAISSYGSATLPSPTVSGRPDFSVLAAVALQHRYDLGRQDGGALESDLSLLGARQFQVGEANVMLADLVVGPKTHPFGGWAEPVSVKPLFLGRFIAVHDLTTYWAWGMGAEVASPIGAGSRAALTVLGRRREFVNNADAPTNSDNSGNEATSNLELRSEISKSLSLSFNTNYTRYIAALVTESFAQTGFGTALNYRFTDPLGLNGMTWLATVSATLDHADYDQADASVNAGIIRRQTDYNLGLTLAVPLHETLTLVTQGSYSRRDASLSNFAYDSFTALAGISWRF